MNTTSASSARPGVRIGRRKLLVCLVGGAAAVAVPLPASAATLSYYGRGFKAGGYR